MLEENTTKEEDKDKKAKANLKMRMKKREGLTEGEEKGATAEEKVPGL